MRFAGVDTHKRYSTIVLTDETGKRAEAKIKTDTIDATTLADLLRADLIPEVHVPSVDVRAQKNLLRQRMWLVGLRTMAKNRIHHILDRNHTAMPTCSDIFGKAGRQALAEINLPPPDDLLLNAHLELLDQVQHHIADSERWINKALCDNGDAATLRSIPGLGKIFAAVVALEIDDIHRFRNPGKLCAYARLVPSSVSE